MRSLSRIKPVHALREMELKELTPPYYALAASLSIAFQLAPSAARTPTIRRFGSCYSRAITSRKN
jgi:hypothetical protein